MRITKNLNFTKTIEEAPKQSDKLPKTLGSASGSSSESRNLQESEHQPLKSENAKSSMSAQESLIKAQLDAMIGVAASAKNVAESLKGAGEEVTESKKESVKEVVKDLKNSVEKLLS